MRVDLRIQVPADPDKSLDLDGSGVRESDMSRKFAGDSVNDDLGIGITHYLKV